MGFKANDLGEEGPGAGVPHLAYMHATGMATALPPGVAMFIIEDSTNPEKIFPMVLVKVDRKRLVFACPCRECRANGKPRLLTYSLSKGTVHHVNERQRTTRQGNSK